MGQMRSTPREITVNRAPEGHVNPYAMALRRSGRVIAWGNFDDSYADLREWVEIFGYPIHCQDADLRAQLRAAGFEVSDD